MDLLSVKIKIADREYPMKVKPEEEQRVRAAGKFINDQLKMYQSKFGIDDKEDLLAMVAFDSMIAKLKTEEADNSDNDELHQKVETLNNLITSNIS